MRLASFNLENLARGRSIRRPGRRGSRRSTNMRASASCWRSRLFPHYPEMTKPAHAASDHAAIWVDLEL
jgi:hypothetical protein